MTLEKAIRVLEKRSASPFVRANPDTVESTRLGIEAMKLNLAMRETYHAPELLKLPGETEE